MDLPAFKAKVAIPSQHVCNKTPQNCLHCCLTGNMRCPVTSCLPLIICCLAAWRCQTDYLLGQAALGVHRTPRGLTRWQLLFTGSSSGGGVPESLWHRLTHTVVLKQTSLKTCKHTQIGKCTHEAENAHEQCWEQVCKCI